MNKLAEVIHSRSNPDLPGELLPPDAEIDRYLELFGAQLLGVVPFNQRYRLRNEAAFHLERLRDDLIAEGHDRREAVRRAIVAYGPAEQLAEQYIKSWFEKSAGGVLAKRLGKGNAIAFVAFALAELICVGLFYGRIFVPVESVFRYTVDPTVFPASTLNAVPIPDSSLFFAVLATVVLVAPILAGAWVGAKVPIHPMRAVYHGLLPCILYSFVSGVLVLPSRELLLFALVQLVYWLPVSLAVAHFARLHVRALRIGKELSA